MLAWVALVPLLLVVERTSFRLTLAATVAYALVLLESDVTPWLAPAVARYFRLEAGTAAARVAGGMGLAGVAYGLLLGGLLVLRRRTGAAPGVLWCAALWAGWEALRSIVPPYLPVAVVGASQRGNPAVLQLASVTGVAGVSALVVAANAALAQLGSPGLSRRRRFGSLGVVATLVIAVAAWGATRLGSPVPSSDPGPRVLLVDGNAGDADESTLERYIAATPVGLEPRPALVVWPESALTVDLERDREAWKRLSAFVVELGATLVTGGVGSEIDAHGVVRRFNSIHVIAPRHGMRSYHKRLLVPLAESWPALLGAPSPAVEPVDAGRDLAVFGDGPARWGPLVCFEITDAASARGLAALGARFIVNVSNDVWFGSPEAPHEIWARVRAVESGLPVVRAANAGTSEVIDSFGRAIASGRAEGDPAVLAAMIPSPVDTVYVRTGEVFLPLCMLVIVAGLVPGVRRLTAPRRTGSRSYPA
jgi:apolipoprotein N-acyltransferase